MHVRRRTSRTQNTLWMRASVWMDGGLRGRRQRRVPDVVNWDKEGSNMSNTPHLMQWTKDDGSGVAFIKFCVGASVSLGRTLLCLRKFLRVLLSNPSQSSLL